MALTDGQLRALLDDLRKRAAAVGPLHALWDLVADGEAILEGRRSLLPREQVERMVVQATAGARQP